MRLALVFGSFAKGAAHTESDLDVAIDGRDVDVLQLAADLSEAIGLMVDVVTLSDVSIPLQQELVATARPLHEAVPGLAAAWRSRTWLALEIDGPWYQRMQDAWLARVAAAADHTAIRIRTPSTSHFPGPQSLPCGPPLREDHPASPTSLVPRSPASSA